MTKKIKLYHIFLLIGYCLVFIPFIYSIFYSMPANDDFAWAIEWWSKNRVVEMFHRINWNYNNSFGNSGIFAIAIQILFNPLYLFNNVGHSFGICMIIANVVIMIGILWAVRTIFKYMFQIENQLVLDVITFLVALLVTTSYYYSDVYNWWSGTPGYSGMMMMCMITCASILRYLADTSNKKRYICMIIVGMITCTSMMYCVAIGTFYVLFVFIENFKNRDSFKKKALPLILYIVSGVLMVIAPGNYTRMSNENSTGYSIVDAVSVTGHRIISRFTTTIQTKPWVLAIVLLIALIGLCQNSKKRQNLIIITLGTICLFVSAFSGLLLYVYGSAKTIDSEFTPRVYYVEDYMMFIGFAVIAYGIGVFIAQCVKQEIAFRYAIVVGLIIASVGCLNTYKGETYKQLIQYDIHEKALLIKVSWYFWDDILNEVITAEDGADVVIDRENVDWCQYSYYVSLDDIPRETLGEDAKYGNCNQCASKYYGVDSIIVNLY